MKTQKDRSVNSATLFTALTDFGDQGEFTPFLQNDFVDGIEAEVIDLRTLRPLDYDTVLASVQKTNRCVTVEEGFPVASIGNHLSAVIMTRAFDYLDAPVLNCTGKDVPMPYAANLEKLALLNADDVVDAVHKVTYR